MIPFDEFMPDQATYQNPGTAYVNNVLPRAKDYGPVPALTAATDALTARAQGGISVRANNGGAITIAGDATKLYQLGGDLLWTDVSKTSTTYTTPSTGYWEFAKYGSLIIATNNSDVLQKFDVDSATQFSDLGGSPPSAARHIAAVRDFVVLGDVSSDTTLVQWSGFNNAEQWTVGTNQSDKQQLFTGGRIQRIIGGEVGYVFKESSIFRMTYEGLPTVFRFDEFEENRGLLAPGGAVRLGNYIFFMANDGFFRMDARSGATTPIGAEKLDRTVYNELNTQFLDRVSTAVDPVNQHVYWLYPTTSQADGTPNKAIIHNWVTQKWSQMDLTADLLLTTLSSGYTLEGLDSVDDLDSLLYSLDSNAWNDSAAVFGAFTTLFKLGYFTGSNLEATLDTQEFAKDNSRIYISGVRPVVDTSAAVASIASAERRGNTPAFSSETSQEVTGMCPAQSSGRYHRARVRIPSASSWTAAQGVEIESQPDGYR